MDRPQAGLAPRVLGVQQRVWGRGIPALTGAHGVSEGVGVAMGEPLLLEPGDDLAVFGGPGFGDRSGPAVDRDAGVSLDVGELGRGLFGWTGHGVDATRVGE